MTELVRQAVRTYRVREESRARPDLQSMIADTAGIWQARLNLPDAFQAATALRHRLTLVTRDTRDFTGSSDLPVLVPYHVRPA